MRVALLGASGFVGKHLSAALRARGDEVVPASLRDPAAAARTAAGCDAVVNLSGETLAQRWSAGVKQRIFESRTAAPSEFLDEIANHGTKPVAYVSASAIGYYGTSETETYTEQSQPGNDFLANVCLDWERVAQRAAGLGMRVACIRCGLVLGADGGAMAKILPIFKAGTGGRTGSGKQWYSWIHIDDAVGIYLLAIDGVGGALNATAPEPVRNEEFAAQIAHALHKPAVLPAPGFMIKAALGEGAVLLLEGQRVLPERTQAEGYRFKFPALKEALENVVNV